jgi:aryl sulfotransferase
MFPIGADNDESYASLCEAYDSWTDGISTRVSAAGFDELAREGPLVTAAMAAGPGMSGELIAQQLNVSKQSVIRTTQTLISGGYLKRQIDGKTIVTPHGRTLTSAIGNGTRIARWRNFTFRQGDIVISAWPKSGITWMQMICALLIFQDPDLPAPLQELSPWLDQMTVPRDKVYAELEAQKHRRLIKTHSPLNEIPIDPQVTYIVIARHPLDATVSMYYQNANIGGPVRSRTSTGRSARVQLPPLREWLLRWLNDVDADRGQAMPSMASAMQNLSAAWAYRNDSNVVLLHYEDLCADLAQEMRYLAARLGLTVPDGSWPALVKAATFEEMRAHAVHIQPFLKGNEAAFFRKGTSGGYRGLLTDAQIAQYYARTAQLAPADLLTWLHRQDRPASAESIGPGLRPSA